MDASHNPVFPTMTTLFERNPAASPESLPSALARAYDGGLTFPVSAAPAAPNRPYLIANFVETLDGVVSYNAPGWQGGGPISGDNPPDHLLMGMLRASADAVICGAGSLREDTGHVRVPAFIYPPAANAYAYLRRQLGYSSDLPLNVILSASGQLDLTQPTFHYPGLRVVILTTATGATRLSAQTLPASTTVHAISILPDHPNQIDPAAALNLLAHDYGVRLGLHEGGPRSLTPFLAAALVDELFLTLAPQLAGRADTPDAPAGARPALVEGHAFTPSDAPWSTLLSLKRAGSHLFPRYRLTPDPQSAPTSSPH